MENILKAEKIENKDSEDEREGEYGSKDEKTRSDDDNPRESISPIHSKQSRNKSTSRSCSQSSSASSDSPKRSRSRSLSKEQPQHDPLEKGSEKAKELAPKIPGKLETSDKKYEKSLHNKSNRNYRDQRKKSRSRSRERTPRSSRSSTHKNHGGRKRSRSRSKDRRSKSIEKRNKRSRSRERRSRSKGRSSRSKDRGSRSRDRRSRSRDRRSRSRERRSRSRDRRSKSRDRRERRSRSRSRDRYRRSRSRDRRRHRYDRRRSHSRGRPRDFKEKALSNLKAALEKTVKLDGEGLTVDTASLEKPSNLPLNLTSASVMTPQIVLQQAMAAMSAKAQALTGISLPKYYNPAAVNPLKYAEQVQKRKLLWQANKEKPEQAAKAGSASLWENMTFAQDQDGKMTAKFRKLMGIKSEGSSETQQEEEKSVPQSEDAVKKQEALFRDLDQQYEMARMSTHTHRGVGLGYTSHASSIYPPVPK